MHLLERAQVGVVSQSMYYVTPDDLIALYYAMPFEHRKRGGCAWAMRPETMAHITRIKLGSGAYLYGALGDAPPVTLLGCPVREDLEMPYVGPGKRSVLFVDFEDRDGPVLALEHAAG